MIMIPVDDDNSLFVYGFNDDNELVFRTSHNPKHIRHEPIVIRDDMCYVAMYYFPAELLGKLPDALVDNQGVEK